MDKSLGNLVVGLTWIPMSVMSVAVALWAPDCVAKSCIGADATAITPFVGQWRNAEGDVMTIKPGFFSAFSAMEKMQGKPPFVAHLVDKDTVLKTGQNGDMFFDCQTLDRQGVQRLVKDAEEEVAFRGEADEKAALGKLRAALVHPPYKIIDVTPYESREVYVLTGNGELLDLFLGEATFRMIRYSKVVSLGAD